MDKRILEAVLVIGLVSLAAGAGTYAYFSDTETSTGNTFTGGTLDLQIKADGNFVDGVTATWTMSNMVPGVSKVNNTVALKNVGIIAADHMEISVSNSFDDPIAEDSDPVLGADGMDEYLEILVLQYDGIDLLTNDSDDGGYGVSPEETGPKIIDLNDNGYVDLDDLEQQSGEGSNLDDLPLPPLGFAVDLFMEVQFHSNAPNDYQGDTTTTTVMFTLNQDPSQ